MSANETRGELEIRFEGVAYGLRPSYAAIDRVEVATGKGLLELADCAGNDSLDCRTAATIVVELMKAWGAAAGATPTPEQKVALAVNAGRVRELIYEEGLLLVARRLALLLFRAATGGYTASGEAKATGTTTEILAAA